MKIKHNDLIIEQEKPFANCRLDRKPFADILTNIVENYKDGFVLAINNEWGTGKTTFVKMWEQQLKNEGYKTLYFNAWENDIEEDVMITLISEFKELKEAKTAKAFDKVVENAVPLVKSLAVGFLKTQIEKHIGKEFVKDAANIALDSTAENLQNKIDDYIKRKNTIDGFRKNLRKFVEATSDEKPIVFIIDELDRCRPNYAVEVLEQIKHLFSVSGIVFVLSIDKTQLGNAVCGMYGSDLINSEEYLRRFIDIEYSLPEPNTEKFCTYLYDYFDFNSFLLSKERQAYQELIQDRDHLLKFSTYILKNSKITLRIIEKIFAHARLVLNTFKSNNYIFPELFIFIIFLRNLKRSVYLDLKQCKYSIPQLVSVIKEIFNESEIPENLYSDIYVLSLMICFYNNSLNKNTFVKLIVQESGKSKLTFKSDLDETEEYESVINYIDNFGRTYRGLNLNYLIDKIELIEPTMIK